jgi:hypothetical protein
MYKLIIFDVDGMLADLDTGALYLGVLDYFSTSFGTYQRPEIAFASNQGGPACHDAGWPSSGNFPTLAQVEAQCSRIAGQLGARLYMCLAHELEDGRWIYPANVAPDDPRLNHEWRKPRPGMLLQAMADAGATPTETLVVGDRPEDEKAAQAAGCLFEWADKFWQRWANILP